MSRDYSFFCAPAIKVEVEYREILTDSGCFMAISLSRETITFFDMNFSKICNMGRQVQPIELDQFKPLVPPRLHFY